MTDLLEGTDYSDRTCLSCYYSAWDNDLQVNYCEKKRHTFPEICNSYQYEAGTDEQEHK